MKNPEPQIECAERIAARTWWKSRTKDEAKCDQCSKQLVRDDGYLLRNIEKEMGGMKFRYDSLVVCPKCFEVLRDAPRFTPQQGTVPKYYMGE